ncbi:hypothetical protein T484DRAFT_1830708 [Baffinella frigidus]|nr:hypothetical protein T484DRAFT_1830708 [Cryptophyta sp. CCMP2293]
MRWTGPCRAGKLPKSLSAGWQATQVNSAPQPARGLDVEVAAADIVQRLGVDGHVHALHALTNIVDTGEGGAWRGALQQLYAPRLQTGDPDPQTAAVFSNEERALFSHFLDRIWPTINEQDGGGSSFLYDGPAFDIPAWEPLTVQQGRNSEPLDRRDKPKAQAATGSGHTLAKYHSPPFDRRKKRQGQAAHAVTNYAKQGAGDQVASSMTSVSSSTEVEDGELDGGPDGQKRVAKLISVFLFVEHPPCRAPQVMAQVLEADTHGFSEVDRFKSVQRLEGLVPGQGLAGEDERERRFEDRYFNTLKNIQELSRGVKQRASHVTLGLSLQSKGPTIVGNLAVPTGNMP